ncbi:hypothetical protein [Paenibacillus sp. ov031]|nr:hypothetical protein [Paenibacillus sp. ov031]
MNLPEGLLELYMDLVPIDGKHKIHQTYSTEKEYWKKKHFSDEDKLAL